MIFGIFVLAAPLFGPAALRRACLLRACGACTTLFFTCSAGTAHPTIIASVRRGKPSSVDAPSPHVRPSLRSSVDVLKSSPIRATTFFFHDFRQTPFLLINPFIITDFCMSKQWRFEVRIMWSPLQISGLKVAFFTTFFHLFFMKSHIFVLMCVTHVCMKMWFFININ